MKIHRQKLKTEKEGGATADTKTGPSQAKVKVCLIKLAFEIKKKTTTTRKLSCIALLNAIQFSFS